jgi:AcrR family transcriptional regulator
MASAAPAPARAAVPNGRPFRGVPSDERLAQRRKQLVEAGFATFGTRGFHETGVRDVCAAARLTERYFYESFRNLEGLFLAVYGEAVERVRSVVTGALAEASGPPPAIARAALRAVLHAFRDDPRLARVLLLEILTVGPGVGDAQQIVSASFAAVIASLAHELHPDLDALGLDPQLLANALYGSTLYLAMRWVESGFREHLETVLDHCVFVYESMFEAVKRRKRSLARSRVK